MEFFLPLKRIGILREDGITLLQCVVLLRKKSFWISIGPLN